MYDCLYILVMSFSLFLIFCNYFHFIINVYTFVFVICNLFNLTLSVYWSLLYGFVCDPLAVLIVLSVQALIKHITQLSWI